MTDDRPTPTRVPAHQAAARLGEQQGSVVSRPQLYALGLTRGQVRAEVRGRRWRVVGRHCVVLHQGPLTPLEQGWAAVLEGGPRAVVDGASALVLAGLQRWECEAVRVSVPRGARVRHPSPRVDVRQTRRWCPGDRDPGPGVPRTRPGVAAVRGALWARTPREATLLVTMAVQQRVVTVDQVAEALLAVRRDRRRALVQDLVVELAGGVGSLGELDVVRGCAARGLPAPVSQWRCAAPGGTAYLDLRWPRWGVVVEVDGVQHAWAEQLTADSLRHNAIALDGDLVLRLPVVGLRLAPDAFFAQVRAALVSRGWVPGAPDVMRPGGSGDQDA